MDLHISAEGFLIFWLALSGVIVFARGLIGSTRTYTLIDSIGAVIEIGFLIWLVTVVAR